MTLSKGFVQVYTGNGKGKTTAAIGVAVRAAGTGLTTYFLQIMKNFPYSELKSLKKFKNFITVKQIGNDDFVLEKREPSDTEKAEIVKALDEVKSLMRERKYDIFALDEICVAVYFGLVKVEDVLEIIRQKPRETELILTGRYCPEEIINEAHLVTRMEEVKHYFNQGILSRKGIDS